MNTSTTSYNNDVIQTSHAPYIQSTDIEHKTKEPSTSYGIINVHLSGDLNKYSTLIKKAFELQSINDAITNIDITTLVDISSTEYSEIYNKVTESLMFLLVSRKHSLGYIGFIKGQYELNDINKIKHLFVQMTNEEIDLMFKNTYDQLWNMLWKRNSKKMIYNKDFNANKAKFNEIMSKYNIHDFKPKFPTREWGFPKGKKNGNESNISCAIRECGEETTLCKSEITILPGIMPLTEIMRGTDNVQYKHVYFLALLENIRVLDLDNDSPHFVEIDTAGWFKKERTLNLIRPYHVEKIQIIHQITNFITYAIYCIEQAVKNDKP